MFLRFREIINKKIMLYVYARTKAGGVTDWGIRCEQSCFLLFYLPPVSKGNKKELSCSLECKYLNSDDYKDLLWTTLSEFPGTQHTCLHKVNQQSHTSQPLSVMSQKEFLIHNPYFCTPHHLVMPVSICCPSSHLSPCCFVAVCTLGPLCCMIRASVLSRRNNELHVLMLL